MGSAPARPDCTCSALPKATPGLRFVLSGLGYAGLRWRWNPRTVEFQGLQPSNSIIFSSAPYQIVHHFQTGGAADDPGMYNLVFAYPPAHVVSGTKFDKSRAHPNCYESVTKCYKSINRRHTIVTIQIVTKVLQNWAVLSYVVHPS